MEARAEHSDPEYSDPQYQIIERSNRNRDDLLPSMSGPCVYWIARFRGQRRSATQ